MKEFESPIVTFLGESAPSNDCDAGGGIDNGCHAGGGMNNGCQNGSDNGNGCGPGSDKPPAL